MGKLLNLLLILVVIDILFLVTGQLAMNSPGSLIAGAILDPSTIMTSKLWLGTAGVVGIAALAATSAVATGFIATPVAVALFVGMALALGTLVLDYIAIFNYLYTITNPVVATIALVPTIIAFVFIIGEWLRERD